MFLPYKAQLTDYYINFEVEERLFPPLESEYFEVRQKGYAELGIDALTLANWLAEYYQVKTKHEPDLGYDRNIMTVFRDKVAEIEKAAKKRETRSKDFFDLFDQHPAAVDIKGSND